MVPPVAFSRTTKFLMKYMMLSLPDHHCRGDGELRILAELPEGLHGEASPCLLAGARQPDIERHYGEVDAIGDGVRQRGAPAAHAGLAHQRPAHGHVARRRDAAARHHRQHGALRLQEPDVAHQRHERDERRDQPPRVRAGLGGDGRVLAEQEEDLAGAGPDERDGDGGRREHQHGALRVDAEQPVLPRAVRLPAQRVQRARHAELIRSSHREISHKFDQEIGEMKQFLHASKVFDDRCVRES